MMALPRCGGRRTTTPSAAKPRSGAQRAASDAIRSAGGAGRRIRGPAARSKALRGTTAADRSGHFPAPSRVLTAPDGWSGPRSSGQPGGDGRTLQAHEGLADAPCGFRSQSPAADRRPMNAEEQLCAALRSASTMSTSRSWAVVADALCEACHRRRRSCWRLKVRAVHRPRGRRSGTPPLLGRRARWGRLSGVWHTFVLLWLSMTSARLGSARLRRGGC